MTAIVNWTGELLKSTASNVILETIAVVLAILLAWRLPRLGDGLFRRWERRVQSLASNPRRALWIAFLIPIVLRTIQIPLYPPPQPMIHDEFSYLLIADTIKAGRLANPTHPLWPHLETIHVIFDPSYASKYPIGQGLALALPQLIGLPAYAGIWLSCGLMSAAVLWMLQAWLSPAWAFFGTAIVFLRITTLSSWMHSYWGGAVSCIGGALALGALVRLIRAPRRKHALILGGGLAILANSRPYEGGVLGAVLGVTLLIWLIRNRAVSNEIKMRQVVLPLAATSLLTVCFLAWHNYSVTGDPRRLPYERNRELYGTPQNFYWQSPVPAPAFRHREIQNNYQWQLSMHQQGSHFASLVDATGLKFREFWLFFLGPIWSVAFLGLPWVIRRRDLGVPLVALLCVFLAVGCYPFFFPHYLGPIAGALLLVLLTCLQKVRQLGPFGLTLSRLLVIVAMMSWLWQLGVD
ncbi:MAG TPA: hypothetical protein VM120_27625, partial [Bryobacteraceae bacterium]|nr:hypothetical protein [Bryobacteraceae bacterium]